MLTKRAAQDSDNYSRSSALRTLAEKWPEESTPDVFIKHAKVNGFAASRIAGQHSEFGKIAFTRDFDGVAPYRDPTMPISRDHIKRAAERAQVPPEKIDNVVRSLSTHLGWDILKGSEV